MISDLMQRFAVNAEAIGTLSAFYYYAYAFFFFGRWMKIIHLMVDFHLRSG
jgi:hypothetical protein